jgi:hypothetical protein
MGGERQSQPAGTEAAGAQAAAELAEIRRWQERVIKAALVPVWYWWAMAAAIVGYGAARDSGNLVVQATVIPLVVLVVAVLIGATIPELRRRIKVHGGAPPRAAAAVFGMIVLVNAVAISTAASLANARDSYPFTIGCAAGAAVLVIVGPLVNRYLRRLMLGQVRQQISGASQAAGTP